MKRANSAGWCRLGLEGLSENCASLDAMAGKDRPNCARTVRKPFPAPPLRSPKRADV